MVDNGGGRFSATAAAAANGIKGGILKFVQRRLLWLKCALMTWLQLLTDELIQTGLALQTGCISCAPTPTPWCNPGYSPKPGIFLTSGFRMTLNVATKTMSVTLGVSRVSSLCGVCDSVLVE